MVTYVCHIADAAAAAPWARATKNVKKPPGEKGRTFRKPKNIFGAPVTFLIF